MILSCQGISKSFGEKVILEDASFHIEEREKAALVGINGAGKTSLYDTIKSRTDLGVRVSLDEIAKSMGDWKDPAVQVRAGCEALLQVRGLIKEGRTFNQGIAQELSEKEDIVLLCGHYEGIDERVLEMIVDDYMSIGDFVLTGGELPAMAIVDAVSRLVPGVLNNEDSAEIETFYNNLLEYPQYTRPPEFMGKKVPDVLLSGNHKLINEWRLEQSITRTKEHRPDMYEKYMIENPPKEKKKRRK